MKNSSLSDDEMIEKNGKNITYKIENFLYNMSKIWYPGKKIVFKNKIKYDSFDYMLKRNILCTCYLALEKKLSIDFVYSLKNKRLDVLFNYDDEHNIIIDHNYLYELENIGKLSDIMFVENLSKIDKYNNAYDIEKLIKSITVNKARKYSYGKIKIQRLFLCNIKLCEVNYNMIGHFNDNKIDFISILDMEKNNMFTKDNFKNEITEIIKMLLKESDPIKCEWFLTNNENECSLNIYIIVSEIDVDSSEEEEPHVFRWNEKTLTSECTSSYIISTNEIITIMNNSNIHLPEDAVLLSINPYGENSLYPCLMVYYVHLISDEYYNSFEYKDYVDIYENPGKILIEGDFISVKIDPKNKKVLSCYKKWRKIKQ